MPNQLLLHLPADDPSSELLIDFTAEELATLLVPADTPNLDPLAYVEALEELNERTK